MVVAATALARDVERRRDLDRRPTEPSRKPMPVELDVWNPGRLVGRRLMPVRSPCVWHVRTGKMPGRLRRRGASSLQIAQDIRVV